MLEDPSGLKQTRTVSERRFEWEGSTENLIPHCLEVLERQFHSFYAFHRFHPPYLVFYYYAKKGCVSLFALPWIKTGFLFLFVYAILMETDCMRPEAAGWVTLGVVLIFWIPGILIYGLFSYRKLWLCIAEGNGKRFVTVTCCVPFRRKQEDRLCTSFEKALFKDLKSGSFRNNAET